MSAAEWNQSAVERMHRAVLALGVELPTQVWEDVQSCWGAVLGVIHLLGEAQEVNTRVASERYVALFAAQNQLAYWWDEQGRCPCGARREAPATHPHAPACPTAAALAESRP